MEELLVSPWIWFVVLHLINVPNAPNSKLL
jgi:hypothetical protein